MRTQGSGSLAMYPVSSSYRKIVRVIPPYPEAETFSSIQAEVWGGRADPSATGGGFGAGIWRRTNTTFTARNEHSYHPSPSGAPTSHSTTTYTTTHTSRVPLSTSLLCCWSVLYVPFCPWRYFLLTYATGQRRGHMRSRRDVFPGLRLQVLWQ